METTELTRSGLPLVLTDDGKLALGEELTLKGRGHKLVSDMAGLFHSDGSNQGDEWAYDTYRAIAYPQDRELFERERISYDITVIAPGAVAGEPKKTSGHYHGWNEARTNTYGEVYEVLLGTALFMLQRSDDFEENPEGARVRDCVAVTVESGQTLVVPPNYGHCSINAGEGPLVFSNLAYVPCPVLYDSVKAHHGMAYYALRDGRGQLELVANDHYRDLPAIRRATVHECPDLGIDFSRGAYENFVSHPDRFDYLPHPDEYVDKIMGLLDFE